jgi:hypothetical protein
MVIVELQRAGWPVWPQNGAGRHTRRRQHMHCLDNETLRIEFGPAQRRNLFNKAPSPACRACGPRLGALPTAACHCFTKS